MHALRITILALAVFLQSTFSQAATIRVEGYVSSIGVSAYYPFQQIGIGVGSLMTSVIELRESVADDVPADPTIGRYWNAVTLWTIQIGSWSSVLSAPGGAGSVYVLDQATDHWAIGVNSGFIDSSSILNGTGFEIYARDPTGTLLSSDAMLPGGPIELGIGEFRSTPSTALIFRVTSIVVPEPAVAWLLGLFVAALGFNKWNLLRRIDGRLEIQFRRDDILARSTPIL